MKNLWSSKVSTLQSLALINLSLTFLGLYLYGIDLLWLSVFMYFAFACLGITVTFHRYLTHKSFLLSRPIEKFFSVLGCLSGTGSSIAWVATHFNHHRFSDHPGDPHSPKYVGWKMLTLDYVKQSGARQYMKDLLKDPFHQLLHRYYLLIHVAFAVVLACIDFKLMIFAYSIPSIVVIIMSNVVNYVGHMPDIIGGQRTHNLRDDSANNPVWSLVTFGESMHNNHHRFPKSPSTGTEWYHFDISYWVIKLVGVKE